MAKFRVRLKLQGMELEIDGEREDMPAITTAVQQQLAGLIRPAAVLGSGEEPQGGSTVIDAETDKGKPRPARKRQSGSRASGDGSSGQAIEFRHEPEKYGNPQQSWSVTEKSIWLLALLKGIAGLTEVHGAQLAATFNQNFKQAKTVYPPHVTRDLGNAKVQNPAPVGEQKGLWYLTNEGERQAQQLIQSVLNSPAA